MRKVSKSQDSNNHTVRPIMYAFRYTFMAFFQLRKDACKGKACPHLQETQSCDTGVCCPADCQLGGWGEWSACTGTCGGSGTKTRKKIIQNPARCKGSPCSDVQESSTCTVPCCPSDCQVAVGATLSAWSCQQLSLLLDVGEWLE